MFVHILVMFTCRSRLPVVSEVVLSSEGLPADLTGVRSLIRVSPLMNQQVVRLCKMAAAILADELLFGSIEKGVVLEDYCCGY